MTELNKNNYFKAYISSIIKPVKRVLISCAIIQCNVILWEGRGRRRLIAFDQKQMFLFYVLDPHVTQELI